MYVCPICNCKFSKADAVAKHSLACWKEHNPNHKSNPAPRSEDIVTIEAEPQIYDFFANLQKGK